MGRVEERRLKKLAEKGNKDINESEPIYLETYNGIGKFKSIRRAMRRGNATIWGIIVPKRPFNNRKRTTGRKQQLKQENLYGLYQNRIKSA